MFRVYFKSTGYRCCRSIALVQMFSTREEHSLHVYKTYICPVDLMQIKEMKDAAWMAVGSHVLDIKIAMLGVESSAEDHAVDIRLRDVHFIGEPSRRNLSGELRGRAILLRGNRLTWMGLI